MFDVVPEEWQTTTLKSAAGELFTDGDWVESKDQDPNGEVRLIQLADIGDGEFLNKSARFLTAEKARELRCTLLRPGDLLIARMADPIARCCLFPGLDRPAATVVDVSIVRPSPEVDREYLSYAISAEAFRNEALGAASGTTRSRVSRSNLGGIELPLPPLGEQRRIAEVLRAVDDVIAANAQAVSQAVCLLRDSRFALTGLDGSRPDWRRGPLLDFFQLQRGHDLPVQDRKEGPIPVIASNGPVGTHNEAAIPAPAVVTGRSGTIGKVTYFDGPCWPLNTTLFVRDYKGSNPRYVFHFLSAFPLTDYQSGTGVPTLNRNDVHVVEVPWPTLEEQANIAASLDALEQSVATMTAGLDQLRTLKVQLSGDLLSGRVRVPA